MSTSSEADAAAGVTMSRNNGNDKTSNEQQQQQQTKRQRRAAKNEKHAWPQHPKITTAARRNQAYLRAAGLLGGKPQKAAAAADEEDDSLLLSCSAQQQNFGRLLGSADARIRHDTVLKLEAYLKARCSCSTNTTGITELELLKLCKCLWYTLYMADRVSVQDELASKIANLVFALQGTVEQDEYAAIAYMEFMEQNELEMAMLNTNGDDHDSDENHVVMEEIENTLLEEEDGDSGSSDSGEEESEDGDQGSSNEEEDCYEESSSEVDVEEKQATLLQEEEEEEDIGEDPKNVGHCQGAHLSALFVRTFFRTILRHWDTMDKYRIDKFYVVIRYMMNAVYRYMAQRNWNVGIIHLFNDAVYDEALSQTPNGVRYHLIDVCLEELCKVSQSAAMPLTEATFLDVLEPFFALAQSGGGASGGDSVQTRVVENVFAKFLDEYSVFSDKNIDTAADEGGKEETADRNIVFNQVHVGTIAQFIFDIASDEGVTKDSYRKRLYDMHKKYVRRMQKVGLEHDVQLHDDDENGDDKDEDGKREGIEEEEAAEEFDGEERDDDDEDDDDSNFSDEVEPPKAAVAKQAKEKKGKVKGDTKMARPKRLGKKEEGKQSSNPSDGTIDAPKEEEITISIADQKAAKSALKLKHKKEERERVVHDTTAKTRKSKKRRKQEAAEAKREAQDAAARENKRVKFHNTNKSRSWTASMKNLRTMETPISRTTPERSILLNKGKPSKKAKNSARKKATDYFKI